MRNVVPSRFLKRNVLLRAGSLRRITSYSTKSSLLPHQKPVPWKAFPRSSILGQLPKSLFVRFGSSGALSKDEIQRRILEVLGSFEKCDPAKITPTASFTADLGLDSLDAVEVVMAIEEEFSIEIPDEEADQITTVSEAISYIERTPEAI
ncbi:hypothetical protein O181_094141 [Austropuccinia psidii MF-1]|uniref:Acyl carrier protein n=1 Tax=Austropuccinia psidii MF-1 TaxID=1389203 RepID=A0A9Q3J2N4_9BASI|nr:hypothetical protein [Austropuccinia psidii MF-1]